MKKLLLSMAFVYFLSLPALRAQDIGNCSIIMCNKKTEENGNTNLLGVFSGFNAKAISDGTRFETMTVFQGYTPEEEHTYKLVITNLKDDAVVTSVSDNTFTLQDLSFVHRSFTKWSVTFPEAGKYCITVYVDDRVAQKLYFGVGN